MRRRPALLLVIATALLVLTGCSDFVDQAQTGTTSTNQVILSPSSPVGQTFVAHHGGLNGVEVALRPGAQAEGTLLFHLRSSPLESSDLVTARVSLSTPASNGFYRFSFPPILNSNARYYYGFIEQIGSGEIAVPSNEAKAYADGALYGSHRAQAAQTVFRLSYDPWGIVVSLLIKVLTWTIYGLIGLVLLFFSGYWIVRRYALKTGSDFTITAILSSLGAVAAYMVLLVWAYLFHVYLTSWGIRAIVGVSTLAGMLWFVADRANWRRRAYWLGKKPWTTVVFWGVVLSAIGLRLFAAQGLVVLPGADVYHHTLIAQLFADQGGIPRSYEPYAPLVSFSYHFGFHSIVALVRWLFGTELLPTTLSVALVLNGAIAAVVGLLAEHVANDRRAAIVAAVFAGLILASPFCLLMWGRVTQTTGLLFLGAAIWAVMVKPREAGWLLPSLLIGGMVVSHYRVALYWGLFVLVSGLVSLTRRDWGQVKTYMLVGGLSALLIVPWLANVAWVQYDPANLRITYPVLEGAFHLNRLETPVLSFPTNWLALGGTALLVIVAWAARRQQTTARILLLWCFALVIGALLFPLTGSSFWDLTTTVLSLPIPVALLAGIAGASVWGLGQGYWRLAVRVGLSAALLVAVGLGAPRLPNLLNENRPYLRQGDLETMQWVRDHTPADALFVVNTVPIGWSPGWIVGADAGYWLPLLTGRQTLVPPMIYPEEWSDLSRLPVRLQLSQDIMSGQQDGMTALGTMMDANSVKYAWVDDVQAVSLAQSFGRDPRLLEVFHQDNVRLFAASDDR